MPKLLRSSIPYSLKVVKFGSLYTTRIGLSDAPKDDTGIWPGYLFIQVINISPFYLVFWSRTMLISDISNCESYRSESGNLSEMPFDQAAVRYYN